MRQTGGLLTMDTCTRLPFRAENFIRLFPEADKLNPVDRKYMDSVDLSNVCREFYKVRKQAAADVKAKLTINGQFKGLGSPQTTSKIAIAMETLKNEMASLMEQDLSLMKQLLTLNETIEDLKWQRRFSIDQSSLQSSSCDLSVPSDWMPGSETESNDVTNTMRSLSIESPGSDVRGVENECCVVQNGHCRRFDSDLQFEIDLESRSEGNSSDSGINDAMSPDSCNL